jgi:hypothetical protein
MSRRIDYLVFDADNHMYETTEAFTKYLPDDHKDVVRYVEVNGRTKIALKNRISEYIPNPTFNVVAPPGAQELEFRLKNPSSKTRASEGDIEPAPPPKYIRSLPAFFNPEDRIVLMDELSIDRAMMWPTLASLLEERLADDPKATHVVIHALNQWMHEHWTFDFEGRIFPTPIITLPILDEALRELDWVLEHGARAILVRPAPVPDYNGRRRSFALEEFDPFWERVQASGVLVGMHASDSGFQRYLNEWEGHDSEFLPFERRRRHLPPSSARTTGPSATSSLRSSGTVCPRASRTSDSCPWRTAAPGCGRSYRSSRSSTTDRPGCSTRIPWWCSSGRSSSTPSTRRTPSVW